MSWQLVYTKQAQKDAKKLVASKLKPKAQDLLDILRNDPFQNPPPYEKLVGDLAGAYSSRMALPCFRPTDRWTPFASIPTVPSPLIRWPLCAVKPAVRLYG